MWHSYTGVGWQWPSSGVWKYQSVTSFVAFSNKFGKVSLENFRGFRTRSWKTTSYKSLVLKVFRSKLQGYLPEYIEYDDALHRRQFHMFAVHLEPHRPVQVFAHLPAHHFAQAHFDVDTFIPQSGITRSKVRQRKKQLEFHVAWIEFRFW